MKGKKSKLTAMERRHIEGFRRKPVKHAEFSVWEKEQVWPEPWTDRPRTKK